MNNQQTPLEKLISDKERIRLLCKAQEQKLNDDFTYIQENSGNLLLSGLSSILFPNSKATAKAGQKQTSRSAPTQSAAPMGMADYLSVAKGLLPVAWDLAQPIIMSWGIKKAQKWFLNLLFKKKKLPPTIN